MLNKHQTSAKTKFQQPKHFELQIVEISEQMQFRIFTILLHIELIFWMHVNTRVFDSPDIVLWVQDSK